MFWIVLLQCAHARHTALVVMSHGWTAIWIGFSSSRLYCAFARPLSLPRCNTGTEGIHGWPWRVSIHTETSLCCSCAVCPFALCNADGCGCSPSARTVNGIDRWRLPVSQKRGCCFTATRLPVLQRPLPVPGPPTPTGMGSFVTAEMSCHHVLSHAACVDAAGCCTIC